jgi:outer membrane immunogenic protein
MLRVLSGAAIRASILALTATNASAADLDVAPPAAAPVAFTWTGCHVGGHLGAIANDDTNTNNAGVSRNFGAAGFLGGGQIGCDYQFAPSWVIGAEGRGAWSSLRDSRNATIINLRTGVVVPSQFITTTDFLASATARLGYVHGGGRWMFYVRGGAAWTRDKYEDPFAIPAGPAVDPTATSNRTGWTVGGGEEWAFAPQWSVNVEYNYYDFGTQVYTLTNAAPVVHISGFHIHDRINTLTTGVNYHF